MDKAGNDNAPGNELHVSVPVVAPSITITSPTSSDTYTTQKSSINISGEASDNVGIKKITWSTSSGQSGTATGTQNWSVSGLALKKGENIITVKVFDNAGNTGNDTLTVIYNEPQDTNPPVSSSDLISNLNVITGKAYQVVENIAIGSKSYIDRSYKFKKLPDFLINASYIMTAKGDRYKRGYPFISFDVNQNVTVYIAHYDGIIEKPSWLNQFTDTGYDLETNVRMSIYKKDFPAGRIELGENGGGAAMYSVMIIKK